MITRFNDKAALAAFRAELVTALDEVGREHGIQIELGTLRYSELECKGTLNMSVIDGGTVEPKMVRDFKRYAKNFGIPEEALGSTITFRGKDYTVAGLKPNSPKYPVLVRAKNGKLYKLQVAALVPNQRVFGVR